jgi:hypothetical protein
MFDRKAGHRYQKAVTTYVVNVLILHFWTIGTESVGLDIHYRRHSNLIYNN